MKYLFETKPGMCLGRTGLYGMISKAAKRARIKKLVYPHLFRHMRALEFRRAGAQSNTVMNAMGWTDTSQYDKRYGKRTALETLDEARGIIEKDASKTSPAKAIDRLVSLLSEGKIDLKTYQASIDALMEKHEDEDEQKSPHVAGYI